MSGDLLVLERPSEAEAPVGGAVSPAGVSATSVAGAGADRDGSAAGALEAVGRPGVWADYRELTKPRIVTMILIVTTLSAVFAAGWDLSAGVLVHLLLGTALIAGSAGAFNQVLERDVDRRMVRTRRRPLPAERVSVWGATCFGSVLITFGTWYLSTTVGWVPALVGLVTWVLYVLVYTPLKVRSEWNTTVGAIAGALPMQMGYTAAGGSLMDVEGWLLFGVLLLWQYPHFMAIAWMHRRDYGAAGLQMTPVVEPTGRRAGWQAILGSLLLMVVLVALCRPWDAGGLQPAGVLFAVAAVAVTARYVMASFRFAGHPDDGTARKLLRASIVQLPAAMLVLVVSALI